MEQEKVLFTLSWKLFYKIFYSIVFSASFIFVLASLNYELYLGVILFGVCAIGILFPILQTFIEKVQCTEHTIIQHKLLRKKKVYNWDDLKNVSWTTGGTAEYLNLNFKNGDKVLVNNMWNNYYLLEMELEKRHIKWK